MLQNLVVMFQRPTSSLSAVLPEMDILLTVLAGAQVVVLEPTGLITDLLTLACLWPIHFRSHKIVCSGGQWLWPQRLCASDWLTGIFPMQLYSKTHAGISNCVKTVIARLRALWYNAIQSSSTTANSSTDRLVQCTSIEAADVPTNVWESFFRRLSASLYRLTVISSTAGRLLQWCNQHSQQFKTWCWFVGGDDLTGALHGLWLQWSSCHHYVHHPLLQWTPANPGSPGKWPLKRRERVYLLRTWPNLEWPMEKDAS